MKKYIHVLCMCLMAGALLLQSCDDTKTYADMLDDEKDYIQDFIAKRGYRVVGEKNFNPAEKMEENEYVLFSNDGVYLHIDSLGEGPTLYHLLDSLNKKATGASLVVMTRFLEYSLQYGDTIVTNFYTNNAPEQFYYRIGSSSSYYSSSTSKSTYGRFFASSDQTETTSLMRTYYGSSVPAGWLKPLQYVGDGGRVKVIVPSKMGHSSAQTNVLPYYYEIHYKLY